MQKSAKVSAAQPSGSEPNFDPVAYITIDLADLQVDINGGLLQIVVPVNSTAQLLIEAQGAELAQQLKLAPSLVIETVSVAITRLVVANMLASRIV